MVGFLVLITIEGAPPPDSPSDPIHERIGEGFLGASVWTGLGEKETSALLVRFADRASAEAHLRRRVESADAPPQIHANPPTVRHLVVERSHGRTLDAVPVGSYMTLIHTLAGPGYGELAGRDLDESLESVEPLEGYAGHLRGHDASLEDEVWALVFWSAAPMLPVPPDADRANVAHYRRLQ